MRKFLNVAMVFCFFFSSFININAQESQINLQEHYAIIEKVNAKYNSQLSILNKEQFMTSPFYEKYSYSYSNYLQSISEINLVVFENECRKLAVHELNDLNIDLSSNEKSTLSSKTIKFNYNSNSMTLTYKHIGSKFDTSYKPSVKVSKLSTINYFVMSKYTGQFKNSNTTYSVTATGKIYSSFGVQNNKKFTVNFNL